MPALFHGGVNDVLLTALALALGPVAARRGGAADRGDRGSRGMGARRRCCAGADLSRTVGWFTSMFPVRLDLAGIDLDDGSAGVPRRAPR